MRVIGLTGGISTGKTTVAKFFKDLGVKVYYDDEIVKKLTFSKKLLPYFKKNFPEAIENNQISKLQLKNIITNNQYKLKELENILHPLVNKKRELLILKHNIIQPNDIIMFESPLLFEKQITQYFDIIITTYCNESIQIKRALDRGNINKNELDIYLKNQLPIEEKKNSADYTINTENNLDVIKSEVKNIYNQIINYKNG